MPRKDEDRIVLDAEWSSLEKMARAKAAAEARGRPDIIEDAVQETFVVCRSLFMGETVSALVVRGFQGRLAAKLIKQAKQGNESLSSAPPLRFPADFLKAWDTSARSEFDATCARENLSPSLKPIVEVHTKREMFRRYRGISLEEIKALIPTIAKNKALDYLRIRSHEQLDPPDDGGIPKTYVEDESSHTEQIVLAKNFMDERDDLLIHHPQPDCPSKKAIFRYYVYVSLIGTFSQSEIAAELTISGGTLSADVKRVTDYLKKYLRPHDLEPFTTNELNRCAQFVTAAVASSFAVAAGAASEEPTQDRLHKTVGQNLRSRNRPPDKLSKEEKADVRRDAADILNKMCYVSSWFRFAFAEGYAREKAAINRVYDEGLFLLKEEVEVYAGNAEISKAIELRAEILRAIMRRENEALENSALSFKGGDTK